ncbi:hypothetical protein RN001_007064 [Aquatica leii]|uniref:Uncharacterized protein n=1 Tax=Aquatica leii TaxID=1421715 RepID=A0AAN7P944_9COLE|nr:hypothetical protein RN001_007064 [Aquatica leii]
MNFFALHLTCFIVAVAEAQMSKCRVPVATPRNIAKIVNQCQDEIKSALLSEAVHFLSNVEGSSTRRKREAFSSEEKRIAGCLLQCVYRKMKAVNSSGFPTVEGLVALYTEGVDDREYILASYQAVHKCLTLAQTKHIATPQSLSDKGKTCDIAFDVFDCVSDKIGEYCGQSP